MNAREEINILTSAYSATAATQSSNERIQISPFKYGGTVTYYLEIIGTATASSTGSIRLRRTGTTIDDVTIAISGLGTTNTLLRSISFSPNTPSQEYFIFIDSGGVSKTVTIKAARIIVIQNYSATTFFSEKQIEIGNTQTNITATTAAALNNPKYWLYTVANWDGIINAYFEVVMSSVATKNNAVAQLQVSDGTGDGFAGWTNVTNGSVTITGTTATRARTTTTFTLISGRNYRIVVSTGNSKSAVAIYNAKIIISQSAVGDLASTVLSSDANLVGYYKLEDATAVIGANLINHSGTIIHNTGKLNDAADLGIVKADGKAYHSNSNLGISGNGACSVSFWVNLNTQLAPGSGYYHFAFIESTTGADRQMGIYYAEEFNGGPVDLVLYSSGSQTLIARTLTPGTWYHIVGTRSAGSTFTLTLYLNGSQIVTGSFSGTTTVGRNDFTIGNQGDFAALNFALCKIDDVAIFSKVLSSTEVSAIYNAGIAAQEAVTKWESQYLLANTLFAAGTALQTFLTKWDSVEWDAAGGSVTYKLAIDAANNSTSVAALLTSDDVTTVGTVSSPDNEGISAALTMPSNQNLDVKATTNNSDIYAAKILVAFVYAAIITAGSSRSFCVMT